MKALTIAIAGLIGGVVLSLAWPQGPQMARTYLSVITGAASSSTAAPSGNAGGAHAEERAPEGTLAMTAERIATARIDLAEVAGGSLSRRLTLPGTIVPDRNNIWRVAARIVGTVSELRKGLGDEVRPGELLAILDSREVAEARSDYITALVNFGLQKTLFEREETLWRSRIQAEQQYLRARNAFTEAQLRLHLAKQKLAALGVSEQEIAKLSAAPEAMNGLQRYEIRSPGLGRVVERMVDLGTPVGGEGQAKELYSIIDLKSVWVELAVSSSDLSQVREGNKVTVSIAGNDRRAEGKIVFISPVFNPETRSARVFAAIPNDDLFWRPGSFVSADVEIEKVEVETRVPRAAMQTVEGSTVVFVRTETGFQTRKVVLGKQDEEFVEIAFGVDPGETIAISNTFLLKAELGKSEAEHSH
ncbi:MAG: efflux RND transporter periplasmic adaptor subunit [Phreatobacter sp.]|jgi:cobalt-zinc-cadmium efflux system membrane fusion protein|uniref:efflux RND transporter periplasmic adaptor subunit n=1 Tax=Phreatobacter sp. TaxID=1966341 RepID=UPI001A61F7E4|nr:efflux RND transporter periplasmic adaptor subunit [Phreatobacter sp.]MBL8571739.1 efflux RND transporter periplasmic adaptor subunit [Phreatobacter sp.]